MTGKSKSSENNASPFGGLVWGAPPRPARGREGLRGIVTANWRGRECRAAAAVGRFRCAAPAVGGKARAALFDFSPPYISVSTAIYADASIAGIHEISSLKGFEVAVQEGDACAEQLRRAGISGVRIFPIYEALVAAAANHSVKLFCLDEYSADYHLYRLDLQRKYVKAFEVTCNELRRAVRKGSFVDLKGDRLLNTYLPYRPERPANYAEAKKILDDFASRLFHQNLED